MILILLCTNKIPREKKKRVPRGEERMDYIALIES
jgi:hypothetical protein